MDHVSVAAKHQTGCVAFRYPQILPVTFAATSDYLCLAQRRTILPLIRLVDLAGTASAVECLGRWIPEPVMVVVAGGSVALHPTPQFCSET